MYKRFIFLCSIFVYSFFEIALAQKVKYSNEFLQLGIGARALSLSNAVVATTNDANAAYWNPAGITFSPSDLQLSVMHAAYFAGIASFDYGGLVARVDPNSNIGFSLIRFGVDDIPDTSELIDAEGNIHYERLTSFSAADYALITSYARKSKTKPLRYGGNLKIVHRKIGSFAKSWGFGLDFGIHYLIHNWQLGVVGRDITTTFNAWSYNFSEKQQQVFALTGNTIPEHTLELTNPRLIFGIGRKIELPYKIQLLPEFDAELTTDGKRNVLLKTNLVSLDPKLGLEIDYNNVVFFRTGLGNFQKEIGRDLQQRYSFQLNMGVGINIKEKLTLDYALTDIGNNSIALYSHVFSLKFNINKENSSKSSIPSSLE